MPLNLKMNYNVTTIEFGWDPNKSAINLKKHGVSFEEAQTVFDDPLQLSILDKKIDHEERWVTVGMSMNGKILVVVHAYGIVESGKERVRLISARKATKREIQKYEEGI